MVTAFLAAIAGLMPVFDANKYPTFLEHTNRAYPGLVASGVSLDLHDLIQRIRGGAIDENGAVEWLCCMLANATYELSRPQWGTHLGDPEVQFFRHVRNAASHGNKWNFDSKPTRPASWRGMAIDMLKGSANPRHGNRCFGAELAVGDLLALLCDVEGKLP